MSAASRPPVPTPPVPPARGGDGQPEAMIVDPGHPGIAALVRAARGVGPAPEPVVAVGRGPRPPGAPVAVVTGASRGIGRALVERLLQRGWRVGALARSGEDLAALASRAAPGSVLPLVADVTDPVAMAEALAALTVLWRTPDLVVANAGVFRAVGRTWEVDPVDWWADLTVNVAGVMNTLHVSVPGMVAAGRGHFVAMSSGMGGSPSPWSSAYGASKAAVTHLIGSLAHELSGTGVSAFAISPGMVRTDMTDWPPEFLVHRPELANLPDEAFLPVDRVCDLVLDLASGRFDELSGHFLHARDDREALLARTRANRHAARPA